MYAQDWFERLKLTRRPFGTGGRIGAVSPVVWALGLTSFLTDISAEMVNSILPAYLVLNLRLSPLQFGAIDGIYNGLSVALVGIVAGVLADRWARHKHVALFGYGLSAFCKLLLLAVGGAWGWITLVLGLDRLGKGIRTAPRDSIISLHTPAAALGTAFGVHRALDSGGAFLGPLVAFVVLAQLPGAFDFLWFASFVIGLLGCAALWLFVPRLQPVAVDVAVEMHSPTRPLASRPFVGLTICGSALALMTVSDAFIYLLLQERSGVESGYLPLFYVGTAMAYMLFSLPAGLAADRVGRRGIFVAGYAVLLVLYGIVFSSSVIGVAGLLACLALLGLYYAGTEGVLMALASSLVARGTRTTALAILASCIGVAKLLSSIIFGWIWETHGIGVSIAVFALGAGLVLTAVSIWLRTFDE